MKKPILIGLIIFLIIPCCKNTPTIPEIPLERAEIKIALTKAPIILYLISGGWEASVGEPEVIISETNGVGCSISSVKLELMYQGDPTWPITKQGGTINAFGSLSVSFSYEFYTIYSTYDRIKITVVGGDDNGFQISAVAYFDIIYDPDG